MCLKYDGRENLASEITMKYRWFADRTCDELSAELGCVILSITEGDIVIEEGFEGSAPITRRGIEIEFKEQPSNKQLSQLDKIMPGFKRDEG